MNLQMIKSTAGKPEYVLLPVNIYYALQNEIQKKMKTVAKETPENLSNYVSFDPANYVDNPIALARIKAGITQEELAERMEVTQAYISKIERQDKISAKVLHKVMKALK